MAKQGRPMKYVMFFILIVYSVSYDFSKEAGETDRELRRELSKLEEQLGR